MRRGVGGSGKGRGSSSRRHCAGHSCAGSGPVISSVGPGSVGTPVTWTVMVIVPTTALHLNQGWGCQQSQGSSKSNSWKRGVGADPLNEVHVAVAWGNTCHPSPGVPHEEPKAPWREGLQERASVLSSGPRVGPVSASEPAPGGKPNWILAGSCRGASRLFTHAYLRVFTGTRVPPPSRDLRETGVRLLLGAAR